jgi:hypothetical protein
LDPITSENKIEDEKKIHFMTKIADLFDLWSKEPNYRQLFFLPNQSSGNNIGAWTCKSVLMADAVEPAFKDRILTIMATLAVNMAEDEAVLDETVKDSILPILTDSIEIWLKKGKIGLDKSSSIRLKALTVIIKAKIDHMTKAKMDFFSVKIYELAPKWKGEIQTDALFVLNALSGLVGHQIDKTSYRLLSSIRGRDGRNLAAQLLWKSLHNPIGLRLNDNLLLNADYQKLFLDQQGLGN